MIGAMAGDIIGSVFEFDNIDTKQFELFSRKSNFTDDTVMTCAVAKILADNRGRFEELSFSEVAGTLQEVGRRYPYAGYGARFISWMFCQNPQPYNSYGNGSAMRIAPVGFAANSEEEVKLLSQKITEVSHNHPEGLKGAECTAMCIFLARQGKSMEEIRQRVESDYYVLDKTCADYRKEQNRRHGKEICQVSVPQALECFFESTDFEDCMRNCISIGGDSDTIAAIAGGIAEAFYGIPEEIRRETESRLDSYLLEIVKKFSAAYNYEL